MYARGSTVPTATARDVKAGDDQVTVKQQA
jgi:hypothetical protein